VRVPEPEPEPEPVAIVVDVSSFHYTKVLGSGSFGKVLLAEHKVSGDEYAIKFVKKTQGDEDEEFEKTSMVERRVLELGFECPFLTRLYATFQTSEHICYVMECLIGGDLM